MHIFLLAVSITTAQAGLNPILPNIMTSAKGVSSEKLDIIRLIGQDILMAKSNVKEEPANKDQLLLSIAFDRLIEADRLLQSNSIKLENKISVTRNSQQKPDTCLVGWTGNPCNSNGCPTQVPTVSNGVGFVSGIFATYRPFSSQIS